MRQASIVLVALNNNFMKPARCNLYIYIHIFKYIKNIAHEGYVKYVNDVLLGLLSLHTITRHTRHATC